MEPSNKGLLGTTCLSLVERSSLSRGSIGGGTGGAVGAPAPTKFSPGGHRPHDQRARDRVSSRQRAFTQYPQTNKRCTRCCTELIAMCSPFYVQWCNQGGAKGAIAPPPLFQGERAICHVVTLGDEQTRRGTGYGD